MIDTNGLNAALTALIRPIVLDIVVREFANFEHIRSRVSVANETLDVHSRGLANLETAIENVTAGQNADRCRLDGRIDAYGNMLSSLETAIETAIETLGKRVTENMLEADRQLDIHRKEIDTAFRGVGKRFDYGEARLNEAREAIRELQGKLEDAIDDHLKDSEFVTADGVRDMMRDIMRNEVVIQFDLS